MDEAHAARLVTIVYSSTMFAIALSVTATWAYVSLSRHMLSGDLRKQFRASFPRTAGVCIPYLVGIFIAFISPLTSLIIDGAGVVYLAVTSNALERVEFRSQGDDLSQG